MMRDRELILSQAELKDRVSYDPLTGKFVWIKSKRLDLVGRECGSVRRDGYLQIKIMKRTFLAHRLAWLYVHGVWPPEIDHKDRNRANNCISNLRLCTREQNLANQGIRISNSSGFKGVHYNKSRGKFRTVIRRNGKIVYLGEFSDPEDASKKYQAASLETHGMFALVGEARAVR